MYKLLFFHRGNLFNKAFFGPKMTIVSVTILLNTTSAYSVKIYVQLLPKVLLMFKCMNAGQILIGKLFENISLDNLKLLNFLFSTIFAFVFNLSEEVDNMSRVLKKKLIAYAKTKTQISFSATAKLINAFVFATRIVQSLFFLNPKFLSL